MQIREGAALLSKVADLSGKPSKRARWPDFPQICRVLCENSTKRRKVPGCAVSVFCWGGFEKDADTSAEPYEVATPRENLQKERGGLISLGFVDFFAKTQRKV